MRNRKKLMAQDELILHCILNAHEWLVLPPEMTHTKSTYRICTVCHEVHFLSLHGDWKRSSSGAAWEISYVVAVKEFGICS